MAIDTTGMADTAAATPDARASDLAQLPDDVLLKELKLGSASDEGGTDDAAQPTSEDEGTGTAAAPETPDDGEGSVDSAGEDSGGEGASATGEGSEEGAAESGEPAESAAKPDPNAPAFTIFQGADEVEIPTDVKVKFMADGAEREMPFDRVVRLAQMGFYNESRAAEIREFRETLPQIEQEFQSLQEENQILREGWRRALSGDDEYLEAERDAFMRAQSPEARAERAERELALERQRQQGTAVEQQAVQFVRSLVPEFEALQKAAPEVSFEEVVGKFNLLTAPLMVRGQIPPNKFREVERIIKSELRPWAETHHEARVKQKQAVAATANRAAAQAAAAKKQVARAVRPQGSHPTGAPPKPAKKYESASDIMNDLDDILPGRAAP